MSQVVMPPPPGGAWLKSERAIQFQSRRRGVLRLGDHASRSSLDCPLHHVEQQRARQSSPPTCRMHSQEPHITNALDTVGVGDLIQGAETEPRPGVIRCDGDQIQLRLVRGREMLIHAHPMAVDGLMQLLIGGVLGHGDAGLQAKASR